MDAPASSAASVPRGAFVTTHWTVVLEAARPDSATGSAAFGQLYTDYWPPLYAYLRRRGHSPEQAEDVAQDFFVRLLSRQALAGLEREGGRFRSFLLRSLDNFLANEWDRAHAQKRGAGVLPISLDAVEDETRFCSEPPDPLTPEILFERQWVFTLLERVLTRLGTECEAAGRKALFQELRPLLQGDRGGPAYAEIAARHHMSEGAIKVTLHRWRQRYGEMLREEVARTVSEPEEVEEEIRHLIAVVSG